MCALWGANGMGGENPAQPSLCGVLPNVRNCKKGCSPGQGAAETDEVYEAELQARVSSSSPTSLCFGSRFRNTYEMTWGQQMQVL